MAKSTAVITLAVLGALAVSFLVISKLSPKTDPEALKATYASWKKEFNVIYGGPEDTLRFKAFTRTFESISAVNAQKLSYTLGLNAFSAMTDEEFASIKLGLVSKALRTVENTTALPTANLRETVDWIGKGAVQKVKNQGSCGSCWAFSAVGALEGHAFLTGKGLQDFAEQELVDCAGSFGNQGCSGGWMHWAFQYTAANGIATQDKYPYTAVDGACKTVSGEKFKNTNHVMVPVNSAAQLKAAIAKQPVAVALQASATVFRNYKTGVVTGTACGTVLNHGVLAVGYNADAAIPYYNIKNSWGAAWGDQGFIKLGIEDGVGVCGIQQKSSYPISA